MFSGFGSYYVGQRFEQLFRCYPVAMMPEGVRKDGANYGGKVFLPPSALNRLSLLNVSYPMLFEFVAQESERVTYGGVLEFVAEEGRVYLPQWMMETLEVQPGSVLRVRSAEVPLGKFVKLEPQSVDFLDISDPKAVLENALRTFSTLTVGDIVEISYNEAVYRIKILEVEPDSTSHSICVVETDLVTDFAPPVGYVEPEPQQRADQAQKKGPRGGDTSKLKVGSMGNRIEYAKTVMTSSQSTNRFQGEGSKVSGKKAAESSSGATGALLDVDLNSISLDHEPRRLDIPDGQLFFGFPVVPPRAEGEEEDDTDELRLFQGKGQSIRKSDRKGKKKKRKSM
ncbi:uncharacterized protein KNAG_0F00510 [Huiozyma naganishii CBS 8797]|uniref:Ubiquitin fusion degradation protein 1 n=1 Tax=Huiozyma naganishii (strain ATCC MYA-139 / BCRC 22969 / CBS 8797 / KCTC 17520 / NBRC 10181 / NCYC 3082 / Yp74L-3) TaxID=1071383 RepID=J7R781_HUIN7|nr:hypothetical protein KNAG_0F00510 [Kazachstania naganishii CBS 8797]CCK70720.1 hypothetical protein KNAG_0F00510 [Kazachstania naganishii CBS 8797]